MLYILKRFSATGRSFFWTNNQPLLSIEHKDCVTTFCKVYKFDDDGKLLDTWLDTTTMDSAKVNKRWRRLDDARIVQLNNHDLNSGKSFCSYWYCNELQDITSSYEYPN